MRPDWETIPIGDIEYAYNKDPRAGETIMLPLSVDSREFNRIAFGGTIIQDDTITGNDAANAVSIGGDNYSVSNSQISLG
ncbi:MAG: hypothetical protein IJS96_07225, partial [Schwartzia sp.]|nr:hypothetical protein [Schwartzia sp. (in: firmicutes)]